MVKEKKKPKEMKGLGLGGQEKHDIAVSQCDQFVHFTSIKLSVLLTIKKKNS